MNNNLPVKNLRANQNEVYGQDEFGHDVLVADVSAYWLGQQAAEEYARLFAEAENSIILPPYLMTAIKKLLSDCPNLYPGWVPGQWVIEVLSARLFGGDNLWPGENQNEARTNC